MNEKFDRKTAAQLREEIAELQLELAFREMEEEAYAQIAFEAEKDESLEEWMRKNRPQPFSKADKAKIRKKRKERKQMFKGNMPAYAWRAVAMCMVFFLLGSGVGGATVAYVQKQAAPQIEKREGMFGEYITFGSYEQDNNLENGAEPIEWRVLKKEDGKALVISVDALKLMQYHNTIAEDSSVAWETWDVRAWLNGEFLETAFTEEERLRIPTVTVWAEYGPQSKAEPGNDTQDKVFLLSFEEADEYLPGNSARQCKPTTYAIAEYESANGKAWETNEPWYTDAVEGNCSWWLRTPGMFDGSATNVLRNGGLASFTRMTLNNVGTSDFNYGVRPAIWIDLEP